MAGKERSMNRVIQIKEEIKQLETQLDWLKNELNILQKNCDHLFNKDDYIQECIKCHLIESLSW